MPDSEQRLMQAVDQYLQSVEAGTPIPHDQLLKEYSDVGSELRDCLGSLEFLDKATEDAKSSELSAESCDEQFEAPATDDPLADSVLGDYRLKKQIGRGGMGVVYDAEQLSLQRRVAVKVLPFAAAFDDRRLQRFRHEAMSAAALHHPHIVPVFHVGHENGTHFYVMQLIEGQSLSEIVKRMLAVPDDSLESPAEPSDGFGLSNTDELPARSKNEDTANVANALTNSDRSTDHFRRIAGLFVPIAEALEHAHETGIVHRDVKPSNLLLDRAGKLWLTDFGLAMRADNRGLTMTGDVVGTLKYMSPEQIHGNRSTVDHRSDVYSLGLSIYELLAGRPAFDASNRAALIRQISTTEPPPLRVASRAIPADLRIIVEKAIAHDATDRYQTAAEFAADLRCFADDQPVKARRPSLRRRLARWARRHHRAVTAATIVGLLSVAGLVAGNLVLAAEQQKTQVALDDSNKLLDEYQSTLREISTIVNRHQLYDEPAYAAMIRDFADAMGRRSRILQQLAYDHSGVRRSLMSHLRSVAMASWKAGDQETAKGVYQQVRWLADRDVTVARKAFRTSPSGKAVTELASALETLGNAECHSDFDQGNGAKRFTSGIRLTKQAVQDYPKNATVWYWHGVMQAERARLYETEKEKRLTKNIEAADTLRTSHQLLPHTGSAGRLALVLGRIRDTHFQKKLYDQALAASEERVRLLADTCADSFTTSRAEAYCEALKTHIVDVSRTRNRKKTADVNDELLRTARRGFKAFGTTELRKAFTTACAYRLRDIALGIRMAEDPAALMREARRMIYLDDSKERLTHLAICSNALVSRMLPNEAYSKEIRLQAFKDMAFTARVMADCRSDNAVASDDAEDMLQSMKTHNENLKLLLAEEAAE